MKKEEWVFNRRRDLLIKETHAQKNSENYWTKRMSSM